MIILHISRLRIFFGKKTKKKLKLGDRVQVRLLKINYDFLEADFILDI